MIRISVDCMGGDVGPAVTLPACRHFLDAHPDAQVLLVGLQAQLESFQHPRAKLVAATEGLGKRISLAQRFLRTDEIFVGLIVIGLIGLVIDLGFRFLMRRACAWAN